MAGQGRARDRPRPARIDELLSRYSTTALAVADHRRAWTDGGLLPASRSYSLPEIEWIIRNEMVLHLSDVVQRRTSLAITGELTLRDLEAIAMVAGRALG